METTIHTAKWSPSLPWTSLPFMVDALSDHLIEELERHPYLTLVVEFRDEAGRVFRFDTDASSPETAEGEGVFVADELYAWAAKDKSQRFSCRIITKVKVDV